jgi:predicted transcriptional regulator
VGQETTGGLSRRERQIMDVIYRLGEASVADVQSGMVDAPSYSTVRALLRVLTEKGQVSHTQEGPRYVYRPTIPREEARASALDRVLSTFFDGSPTKAMAALMDLSVDELSEGELDELEKMIAEARREGR